MAEVFWSAEATNQIIEIANFLRQFDPDVADRTAAQLFELGESLADFPRRGRPAVGETREMVTVRPYILAYVIDGDRVSIIDIRHHAQMPRS